MFAGLANEDGSSSSEEDDEQKPTAPPPKPPPKPVVQRGPALPEASSDEDEEEEEDEASKAARERAAGILGGIDPDDLEITIDTLHAIAKDLTIFRSRPFKALREAIGPLARELTGAGDADKRGGGRARHKSSRLGDLDPKERMKQMDRDALNHRVLRAERLARLDEMQKAEGNEDTLRLTDGSSNQALLQNNARAGGGDGGDDRNASLNAAQGESLVPFQKAPGAIPDGPAAASLGVNDEALLSAPAARLNFARSCYICKAPYRELHAFYAALCPPCAKLNWTKRAEGCNLHGRVALVTGGRMKIGFRIVLKLLRCGCEVIASTRFPIDATRRYHAETDSMQWAHRLHIVVRERELSPCGGLVWNRPSMCAWPCSDVVSHHALSPAIPGTRLARS